MPQINAAGLAMLKSFESCELTAYADSGGIWTIGWGHTPAVEGESITQAEADELLIGDLAQFQDQVQALVGIVLTPNQFSALVDFQYNTGALEDSPGLVLINSKQFEEAWDEHFCLYVKDANGTILEGLVRRRAAEKELFFT